MLVALMAHDKPGSLDLRTANRAAHIDYLKSSPQVVMAGPLLDGAETMCGSLIVLEVDSYKDAEAWAANDPYKHAGLFANVTLTRWNKVIG